MEGGTGDPDIDAMVTRVIDRASIPGRQREPRLAAQLTQAERIDVGTRHGKLAAWRVGAGPAALLVHGWRDSARLWDPLMSELTTRRRAFVVFDLPGHGLSEGERCLTAEVPDAVAAVAAALGPVDAAVAHSFACSGTAMAVDEGVSVKQLVLIAPPVAYRDPGKAAGDATNAAQQRWRRIAADLGFTPTIGDQALEVYLSSLESSRGSWDLTNGLTSIRASILVVASADDERFDLDSARSVFAQMPNVEFAMLTGLDHRGSARADTAVDAIASFLDHI
jgi:pimeloyl-ACP methyl ester carboxylesterase